MHSLFDLRMLVSDFGEALFRSVRARLLNVEMIDSTTQSNANDFHTSRSREPSHKFHRYTKGEDLGDNTANDADFVGTNILSLTCRSGIAQFLSDEVV